MQHQTEVAAAAQPPFSPHFQQSLQCQEPQVHLPLSRRTAPKGSDVQIG